MSKIKNEIDALHKKIDSMERNFVNFSLLCSSQIKDESSGKRNLITPFQEEMLKAASYDLALGKYCYISSVNSKTKKVHTLKDNETISIPPNSILFFQTEETLNLPHYLAGRLFLKMGFLRKGLIMPAHAQVDPGYSNVLFGLVYNLTDKDILLTRGKPFISIEFYPVSPKNKKTYEGKYSDLTLQQFVEFNVSTSLDKLTSSISRDEKLLKWSGIFIGIVTILVTILTIILGVQSYKSPSSSHIIDQIDKLKEKIEKLENISKENLAQAPLSNALSISENKENHVRESLSNASSINKDLAGLNDRISLLEQKWKASSMKSKTTVTNSLDESKKDATNGKKQHEKNRMPHKFQSAMEKK